MRIGRFSRFSLVGAMLLALTFLVPASPAFAAPVGQACEAWAFRQHDLAGVYTSVASQMRVEVYPCGGIAVQWDNAYGTHYAGYYSDTRLPGGGIAAQWVRESPGKLDMADRFGVKPAEPGFVQIITVSAYAEIIGVYRLRKIA